MMANDFTVFFQRSGCMFALTGVARYIRSLQAALERCGCPLVPFQPYPDGALMTRTTPNRIRAALSEWHYARALPERLRRRCGRGIAHYTHVPARPWSGPTVVTVHDLNVFHCPRDFRLPTRLQARHVLRQLRRAHRVITISQFVRGELLDHDPSLADRTVTVHHGTSLADQSVCGVKAGGSLILFAGGLNPNKNLPRALEAFARARAHLPAPAIFEIAGPVVNPTHELELRELVRDLDLGTAVRFRGPLTDADLATAYAQAHIFMYVSLREGFGLPILEAQAHGCLCIASRTTSLPEVGGDGCVYVDPTDVDAMTGALIRAFRDAAWADSIIARGRRNAEAFTWDRCARETMAVYEAAMAEARV